MFLTAVSVLAISGHNRFRVLFDKIASVYFVEKMYLYFSIGNDQPREPGLCQLYRHTYVPYAEHLCLPVFTGRKPCPHLRPAVLLSTAFELWWLPACKGGILSELLSAVMCTTVVHNGMHTNMSSC